MAGADDGFHHLGSAVAVPAYGTMPAGVADAVVKVMLRSWTCPVDAAPGPARIGFQVRTAGEATGTCAEIAPGEARKVARALLELADAAEREEEGDGDAAARSGWPAAESPEEALRAVVRTLSASGQMSCHLGSVMVCRRWPSRSLLIVGEVRLAAELRKLITAGQAPGWNLYPLPAVRTPLRCLREPLLRLSGSHRCFNLLGRSGFEHVEEVAAVTDDFLRGIRTAGPAFVGSVRAAIRSVGVADAPVAETVTVDVEEPERQQPPVLEPGVLEALRILAAWAVCETGASTAEDLARRAAQSPDLPPEVAMAWDRIRTLCLRPIAGPLLPAVEVATLADELLAELGDRRRLILVSRTFAPERRTYKSLARELGVTRERIRQIEKTALAQLGRAMADDRYAPLRWRAVSAASQPAHAHDDRPDGSRPWMGMLLSWLAGEAGPITRHDPGHDSPAFPAPAQCSAEPPA